MLKHLKEHSQPTWATFMTVTFDCLGDKDAQLRIPSAWAIALAAPLPQFAEVAPEAFRRLAIVVSGQGPKKRDDTAKVALDNAVAALLWLAKEKAPLCPPDIKPWELILSRLPMKDDEEEAQKVHKAIVGLVLAQDAGLLGSGNAHMGKILSILAEVYKSENISETETDDGIKKIFQNLNQDILKGLASNFTEKQMKKIERMLTGS